MTETGKGGTDATGAGAPRPVRRIAADAPDRPSFTALLAAQQPVVVAGLASDWPLVAAGRKGDGEAIAYLKGFDRGLPVTVFEGDPAIDGRFFYAPDDPTRLNFRSGRAGLTTVLDRLEGGLGDPAAPALYVGSTDPDQFLPGFRGAGNDLALSEPMFGENPLLASIWIGNRTVASTHFDMSNNIACCVVGRRRFTLFPPDQVTNLYPGPLEPTPGGQVVSMVDLRRPDLDRYPRFADAIAQAHVADLKPGDVLIYPALWWHNVEALGSFNVLVNYWWNTGPAYMDTPMNTLLHGLLSLRDRPDTEKAAWRALFDHYVFGPAAAAGAHLAPETRGALASPMPDTVARRLRAMLLNKLNR